MELDDPAFWPTDIFADRPAGRLEVRWSDGHFSVYEFEYLRWRCPCAACQGEGGVPGALAQVTELGPDQVRMREIQPVGSYAVQPIWADGHDTGLYGLRFLRTICPCPDCRKRSSRVPEPPVSVQEPPV